MLDEKPMVGPAEDARWSDDGQFPFGCFDCRGFWTFLKDQVANWIDFVPPLFIPDAVQHLGDGRFASDMALAVEVLE